MRAPRNVATVRARGATDVATASRISIRARRHRTPYAMGSAAGAQRLALVSIHAAKALMKPFRNSRVRSSLSSPSASKSFAAPPM